MLKKSICMAGLLILALPFLAYSQQLLQPESAVYDLPRERYLISNFGNGRLIAIDKNGIKSLFAEGKSSSAGLHIIDDTVYVGCGGEGVLAYNLVTGDEVMDLLIPGSVLLNDVTADTSGNLYVSDPYGNKIYKIKLSDRSYSVLVDYVYWPNGLLFNKKLNRLLACTSTTRLIYSVDMNDGTMTELVNVNIGHLDGLAEDNAGNFYVSSQGVNAVYRYNSDFTSDRELVSSGHNGPADIYYNKWHEILVVPNIGDNTVDFIYMPTPLNLATYDFSDANYGDGDGILEAGEEIELTFSLENVRPDTMFNTSVNLYCQDISLTMTDNNIDFGDVAQGDMVDNISAPTRFVIPADYIPRIDSFYVEINYTCMGDDVGEIMTILKKIGSPQVLLVDQFSWEEISYYYTEALEDLFIPSDLWDIQATGTPASSLLSQYEVVIWFTGSSGANLMDNDQILSMKEYMDSGGNLFLTGQGVAANLNVLDADFLNNYLRCEHISTFYIGAVNSVSTGQVFAPGDTLVIFGGDGASNQENTDHISSLNGSVVELDYVSTTNGAAVSYDGDYNLVFFGFGFEAIRSDDSRLYSRKNTLLDILDFLAYEFPHSAPVASNLMITPGDPTHMIDHTPEISWMYLDEETTPQAFYQIQLGDDNDWLISEMWDTGPVSGSDVNVLYSGSALIDGEDYYIRVRLSDGSLWSDWIYGDFHMNSVPVPTDLSPNNLEEIDVNPPVLSIANIPDIEDDDVTYDYQLYDDAEMTALVEDETGVAGGTGERIYWQIETVLNAYEDYYWRVRSRDDYETGPWSELASFILTPAYTCGDANGDGEVNVGDAVFLINYVFKGGPAPDPIEAGDANGDGQCNVGDAVYLISYVFKGGPAPDCQ